MADSEVDILGSALRLAEILKADPKSLDKNAFAIGNAQLVIYLDHNFSNQFEGLKDLKADVITRSIEDLADRAKLLSRSYLGVAFINNQLDVFECDYAHKPEGSVVYKIGLKNTAAFQKWRTGQVSEISAEDIHAAIYRLTFEWAQNL
jgi:hypothetical protein